MSNKQKNIIRIQEREDREGYQVMESGFIFVSKKQSKIDGENIQIEAEPLFLLIAESYLIKKSRTYLICFEKAIPAVRMAGLRNDVESIVREVSVDETYARRRALDMVKEEAEKILLERQSQGYVLEDLTQQ